ncbi:MAG: hypothetical protein D8M59_04155 [Planctomycetes bacterium]|nr:hypothetical protein [Planctomycetota bacterium]NOG55703.1 hypothetical protein [Planctomycetota bacterium]
MTPGERQRFDRLLDRVMESLPVHIHKVLERVPMIVEDEPGRPLAMELALEELQMSPDSIPEQWAADDSENGDEDQRPLTPHMSADRRRLEAMADFMADTLCGLHTGVPLVERSIDDSHGQLPDLIHIFRRGIINAGGGWDQHAANKYVMEQIRVTIMHELGHHHGLQEDDLAELGYE